MNTFLKSLLGLLFWMVAFHTSNAQSTLFTTDDPVAYADYVVSEQEKIGREFMGFSDLLLSGADTKTCELRRQEVIKQIELSLRRLRNMAPFKGSTGLRDESIGVFTQYRDVHAGEFAKIAAIVANQNSSIAEIEEYYALQVVAERKMEEYTQRLLTAQKAFAKEQGLTLSMNPMQAQFDRILAANIYNREISLAYFAVAKPNEAWWEAMQANNGEGMKIAREQILMAFSESKILSFPAFMDNHDFRDIAQRRVLYYSELAKKDYLEIEKVITSGNATNTDIDRVNSMIDSYNQHDQEQNTLFNEASLALMRRAVGN